MTAALLAVLLLCGTGVAGDCALRCGLARACGHSSAGEATPAPSARCHEMSAPRELDSVACPAMVCDHASAATVVADESGAVLFGVPRLVVVGLELPGSLREGVWRRAIDTSPRSVAGSSGNLVAIRV